MKRAEIVAGLSRLLALEIDVLQAYDAAVAWVGGRDTAIGAALAGFALEHQRHALALHEALLGLGARAPEIEAPDVKGVVIGALTPPRRRPNAQEVLEATRANEQLAAALHREALGLPEGVRGLAEQALEGGRRRVAWIEQALASALWLSTSAVATLP